MEGAVKLSFLLIIFQSNSCFVGLNKFQQSVRNVFPKLFRNEIKSEKIFRGKSDAALRFAQETLQNLSDSNSKLGKHRAQSPVREFKMLAVWHSIAEGFPTARSRDNLYNKYDKYM